MGPQPERQCRHYSNRSNINSLGVVLRLDLRVAGTNLCVRATVCAGRVLLCGRYGCAVLFHANCFATVPCESIQYLCL